jgi:hypothetical protein
LGLKFDKLEDLELIDVELDPDFPRRPLVGLKHFSLKVPKNVVITQKSVHFSDDEAHQRYWISLCSGSVDTLESISITGLPLLPSALDFLRQCTKLQEIRFETIQSRWTDDSEVVAMLVAIGQLKLKKIKIEALNSKKQTRYEEILKEVVGESCVVKGRWG